MGAIGSRRRKVQSEGPVRDDAAAGVLLRSDGQETKQEMLCYAVLSVGYGGAQKRMLLIAGDLLKDRNGFLLVNEEMLNRVSGQVAEVVARLEAAGRLVMVPSVPLIKGRRFNIATKIWWFVHAVRCIVRQRPRIFHSALSANRLAPVARMAGAATIVEITSPDIASSLARKGWWFRRSVDLYHAVSQAVADRFLRESCARKSRKEQTNVVVAPIAHYTKKDGVRGHKKEFLVSFCGRLIPRKNGVLFAEAVAEILAEVVELRVEILGDGPEAPTIRRILGEYIGTGRVSVRYERDPWPTLTRSLVFVSLISPENFPSQSVLEAMDAEAFLLLSETPLADRFLGLDNGVLVKADKASIVAALRSALADRMSLEALGRRSAVVLDRRFCGDSYRCHCDRLYSSIGRSL